LKLRQKARKKMYPYPNLDTLSNAYLQWMFDNQPEYVKEFLDQDRIAELDQVLNQSVIPAWKFYDRRVAEGKSHAEALDLATEALIPKDGPEFSENPPEPLSYEDQEKIRKKLDLRAEAQKKLQALQEKRLPKAKTTSSPKM
jgi:hypothetical protein